MLFLFALHFFHDRLGRSSSTYIYEGGKFSALDSWCNMQVQLSAGCAYLASTSHDAVLRLWDLSALKEDDGEDEDEGAAADAVRMHFRP